MDYKIVSHSEITSYLDCQKKWKLEYIDKIRVSNNHFEFGEMAHKVMETREIPDESLYPELKEAFNINSWKNYFSTILNELDAFTNDYEIVGREIKVGNNIIKGVIDLVLKKGNKYMICDYKFSTSVKDYTDLYLDEQMYIYAYLFCEEHKISLDDIELCYINIPKVEVREPRILVNGKLSKDKGQNTTYEKYLSKIREMKLDIDDYSEVLAYLQNKKFIHIYHNFLNIDKLVEIMANIDNVIKDMNKGYILEKHSYMCKKCPYLQICKGVKI